MKRRVLCLILAVIMVACLLPTAAFASTNGKTADDAINWVRSLEGQPVGSGECVALIVAYYSYLGQTSPGGNGADYSWNQLPAGWQRLQNAQPQKGDILVYSGTGANPYGHVAIYESDYSTWHQNYSYQRKVVHVTNVRYNGFDNPYGASSARTLAARCLSRILSTSAQVSTVISSARTNGCPPERAMTKTQSGM
mgnify:CR=1 FL=1